MSDSSNATRELPQALPAAAMTDSVHNGHPQAGTTYMALEPNAPAITQTAGTPADVSPHSYEGVQHGR